MSPRCKKTAKIRVKNPDPRKDSSASRMDPGRDPDDQDRDNPGGGMANGDNEMNGVNGANGTNGQYRSPMVSFLFLISLSFF